MGNEVVDKLAEFVESGGTIAFTDVVGDVVSVVQEEMWWAVYIGSELYGRTRTLEMAVSLSLDLLWMGEHEGNPLGEVDSGF